MFRAAAFLLAVAAAVVPERAEACSCGGGPNVWPRDGAIDVPANVRLMVTDVEPVTTITLVRTSDGAAIPLTIEDQTSIERWVTRALRPEVPLEVGVYEVRAGGVLVSTFSTTADLDETAPEFEGATAFTPQRWRSVDSFSSCWSIDGTDQLRFEHAPLPDDVLGVVAVLRLQDEPTPFWRGIQPFHAEDAPVSRFSTDVCSSAQLPPLDADVTYCARLSAFDASGNEAGADVEVCGLTRDCWLADVLEEPRDDTVCRADPTPPDVTPDAGSGTSDAAPSPSDGSGGGCSVGDGRSSPSSFALVLLGALLLRRRRR